jgi:hypothetical protein
MAHPADGRLAFGLQRGHTLRAGQIQESRGAEDVRVFLTGVFDHIDEER